MELVKTYVFVPIPNPVSKAGLALSRPLGGARALKRTSRMHMCARACCMYARCNPHTLSHTHTHAHHTWHIVTYHTAHMAHT